MKVGVGYVVWVIPVLLAVASCDPDPDSLSGLVVLILGQEGVHLRQDSAGRLWHPLQSDVWQQEANRKPTIHRIPLDWPDIKGGWTIFPLIPRLVKLHPNASWVLLVQDNTRIDWSNLLRLTRQFDYRKRWFLGHALHDQSPTIIHHFAFHLDPSAFHYPLFDSGFLLSRALVHALNQRLTQRPVAADFAIDPQHELALYLRKELAVDLSHSSAFCLDEAGSQCATWIKSDTLCESSAIDHPPAIYFAVKTCSKFHESRVKRVVQPTWATHIRPDYLVYYSDSQDESIPTVVLDGISNTETGHCAKSMALMADMWRRIDDPDKRLDWLVIADDDTLLSVQRLERLLSCYDPSRPVLLGQRYGYANNHRHGYDYVTGGGGMVLSRAAVKQMAHSVSCRCPRADTADDMWIGACASYLNIAIIHVSGFHQARPDDYPAVQLRNQLIISFHKHWMIDPVDVYNRWLAQQHYRRHQDNGHPADGAASVPSHDRRHLLHPQTRDEL